MSRLRACARARLQPRLTLLTLLVTSVTLTTAIQYTTSNSRGAERRRRTRSPMRSPRPGSRTPPPCSRSRRTTRSATTLPSSEPKRSIGAHELHPQVRGRHGEVLGRPHRPPVDHHGLGIVTDPTGRRAGPPRGHLDDQDQPTLKQALNSNAWNYMFAKDTVAACDVKLETASRSTRRCTSSATSASTTRPRSSRRRRRTSRASTSASTSVPRHRQRSARRRTRSPRRRSARLPHRRERRLHEPCTRRHVHADTILTARRRQPVRSRTSTSGTPTRSRGRRRPAAAAVRHSPTAFESAGSTTMNNSAGPFNLTPSTSYTCQY